MLSLYFLNAGIRQPDSVDHAALEFSDAWGARSVTTLDTHRLGDESSERVEIHNARQLTTVGSRASGKQHRILKFDSRGGDC
jgi:hypothetical protein